MYYSQDGQDKFLHENVFKDYKTGFFVDVGSHDGKTINNTLFFEENYNWIGINIEPLSNVFEELKKNRPNCINLNCAVCNNDGKTQFVYNTGYTEMLSGIKDTFDIRHYNRLEMENKLEGGKTQIIDINTKRLESICNDYNIKHINFLSIDIEGGEFEAIKSINFDRVFIDVIGFENNYPESSIEICKYLEDKNFKIIHECQDIFMINKKSSFIKNLPL